MQLRLISPNDPLRIHAEDHIRSIYREHFGALVPVLADTLAIRRDEAGEVCCAAGLRWGNEPFFLERYLDQAAEEAAAEILGRPVARREIFEVSTLACGRAASGIPFVFDIMQRARMAGYTAVMFTATGRLRRLLGRYGVRSHAVCPADPRRVGKAGHWGSYYAHDPQVCVAQDEPLPGPAVVPAGSALACRFATVGRGWA